jgi:hypothetical protein
MGAEDKNRKRNLSLEGRARVAAAVNARWAAQKKAVECVPLNLAQLTVMSISNRLLWRR